MASNTKSFTRSSRSNREFSRRARQQSEGPAQLVVLTGRTVGSRHLVVEDLVVGRGDESPVAIDDAAASREHARIRKGDDGQYILEDLESRNGTFLNGTKIERAKLHFGDRIGIGDGTLLLFTRHDQFEAQLLHVQKLQTLGELASGVAHDFNNVLATVLTNVSHLKETSELEAKLRECLDDIETAARRGCDFTAQLLSFARKGQHDDDVTRVERITDEVMRLLRRSVNRAVQIEADIENGLVVVGDPARFLQILMNLCINAVDAMPESGTLTLRARSETVSEETAAERTLLLPGRYVVLSVSDTGVGIDEAMQARIFDPFFTTKPRGQGTGLGLATVLGAVQEYGGQIEVESEAGVGTTFHVYLPSARQEASVEQASERMPTLNPRSMSNSPRLEGVVLVVDDEDMVRRAFQRVLERAGAEILCAADGAEALHLYREQGTGIDLVVLDVDMPEMSGRETYRQLREIDDAVNVLICSGHADLDTERELLDSGATGFLRKPFSARVLADTVAEALVRKQ